MLKSPRDALKPEKKPARPPSDKKRPSALVALGSAIFTLLLLATVAAFAGLYFGSKRFEAPGPLAEAKAVMIPKGSGTMEIADALEGQNVIESPLLFTAAVKLLGKAEQLKAGEYQFPAGVSMSGVVDILVDGKVIQHSLTIPEGLTSLMIVERLRADEILTGDITSIPPEGSILPDTYNFERGTTREQMIQRMRAAQKKALTDIWARRAPDLVLKSPAELVTLASIVEKETGVPEERPQVASVFHNRLVKKMKLQSDPTIIYGLVAGKGKLDRPLSKADIAGATPYNTYVIPALPPGPIANPGRASLEAAANPARSDYLYFVADGTGGHAFATTLDEHNQNVMRWRELQQKAQDDAAAAGAAEPAPDATAN